MTEHSKLTLSENEQSIAHLAAQVVQEHGGFISFDDYDKAMLPRVYFAPLSWIDGWGLSKAAWKANNDKLAIFAACHLGFVRPTATGYETGKGQ